MLEASELNRLDELRDFVIGTSGCSWAALVRGQDGSLETVIREHRPCWGELRRYDDGTRPDDIWPDDIPNVIPIGIREALAVSVPRIDFVPEFSNSLIEYVFGSESPWRRGWKNVKFLRRNNTIRGVALTDTDVDPTVMVNLLVTLRGFSRTIQSNNMPDDLTYHQKVFSKIFTKPLSSYTGVAAETMYYLDPTLDLNRFWNGDTVDLSNGGTWRDQEDYNRPELDKIFGTGNTPNIFLTLRNTKPEEVFDTVRQLVPSNL